MTQIAFYQLATRTPDAVLPQLVTKALAAGHKLVIRAAPATLAALDKSLWTHSPDSFLPHALESDVTAECAAMQPVLLTTTALPATNAADCLAQIGDDLPDDLTGLTRILYLFDAETTETARNRWRKLSKLEGITPTYWREDEEGRFEKAA